MATNISEWRQEVLPFIVGCPNPTIDKAVLWTCRDFCDFTRTWSEKLAPIDAVGTIDSDIAFVSGSPCTITTTAGDFTADGWTAGDGIITTSDENPGVYTIDVGGVASGALTLVATDDLVSEDAGGFTLSKASYAISSANGDLVDVRKARFDGVRLVPTSEAMLDQSEANWDKRAATTPTHFKVGENKQLRLVPMCTEFEENDIEVWLYLKPLTTATTVEDYIYEDWLDCITDGAVWRLLRMTGMPWGDIKTATERRFEYERLRAKAFNKGMNGYSAKVQRGVWA